MKNLIIACLLFSISAFMVSCDGITSFLDKPPGVDLDEDVVFSSRTDFQAFVTAMYRVGVHSQLAMHNQSGSQQNSPNVNPTGSGYFSKSTMTDEGRGQAGWGEYIHWTAGTTNINQAVWMDNRYHRRWQAIKKVNVLLERIEEVPGLSQSEIDQFKAEALFIRALNYFEMMKRYGGMPIVKTRLSAEQLLQEPHGRATIEEMVDFIVGDIDHAVLHLPDEQPSNWRGRATKGAALMVKAKTLLTAASPQFNTNSPYLDLGDYNEMIIYGNYDVNRWQLAADAAKEVIDWADEGWARIIDEHGPDQNYKYVWETPNNDEVIFDNKMAGPRAWWQYPWLGLLPTQIGWGNGGTSVNFQFKQKYEKRDGTPQEWDIDGGDDLLEKYAELDYRFHQTYFYHGSRWNDNYPLVQTHQGGAFGWWQTGNFGGAWNRKFIPDNLIETTSPIPNNIIYRLADAYLMYAEALNEARGPVQEAYGAVNIIRNRSGQPDLPAGLSQDEFRDRVRNERAIELAFEDNRFWDIRRWLIAHENEVGFTMLGIQIRRIQEGKFSYTPYIHQQRVFHMKQYLHPFLQNELDKGYLVQNPGW